MSEDLQRLKARQDRVELHLGLRPPYPPVGPPFYGLTPASGLHCLKDKWCQVASMSAQCRWLLEDLKVAIEATEALAPHRTEKQGFRVIHRIAQQRPQNGTERKLEWDLYRHWSVFHSGPGLPNGFWCRLVGFQVPLYDNNLRDGWDKIDLVGLCPEGYPAVIELKRGKSAEKPLRPLLEVAGYAIAFRSVWSTYHAELTAALRERNLSLPLVQLPQKVNAVVLAPADYWTRLLATPQLTPEIWAKFHELAHAFSVHGISIRFGQLSPAPPYIVSPVGFP